MRCLNPALDTTNTEADPVSHTRRLTRCTYWGGEAGLSTGRLPLFYTFIQHTFCPLKISTSLAPASKKSLATHHSGFGPAVRCIRTRSRC